MSQRRVVVTGMGICAPNAIGLENYVEALKTGESGITYHEALAERKFQCHIAGTPPVTPEIRAKYFSPLQLRGMKSTGIVYGVLAGKDAWTDAGLALESEEPDYDTGIVFGVGSLGADKFREAIYLVDEGKPRRLGSTTVIQTMASGITAYLGGMLGCGNQVTVNSSACSTGTEAVLMGYERIAAGRAERMLVGSCGDSGPYIWGGFDAMRILPNKYNDNPSAASRPMSASASGFVPSSGAGALLLETLDSAKARNAKIYAEVLGGAVNSGGQRDGGSMTAPNSTAVVRCLRQGLQNAGVNSSQIDYINGHLTATAKDPEEIANWTKALGREGKAFPLINTQKGAIGHGLSASGSMECVATVLQMSQGFVAPNVNCEDLHPVITQLIDAACVPVFRQNFTINYAIKASFGFGDVNCCVLFRKFK